MPKSGLPVLLGATAIAGVTSYLVTWLVPRAIGFAEYATFAAFWAALYLVVGALYGLQQEVTRATGPVEASTPGRTVNRARNAGVAASLLTFAIILATSPLWAEPVFPGRGLLLVLPFAVGTASYAIVAVLAGTLFGLSRWREAAALVLADALLRLAAVGIALLFTHDVVVLAWAVAAPFLLAVVVLWPFIRSQVVGRAQLDVGYRQLAWNVARTITAAASTGIMVSGFPLVFTLATSGERAALVGMVVLTVTLVRAPLIVVTMSLQGWLLVQFRDAHVAGRLARILGVLGVGGVVLGAAGWWLGPTIFAWLYPGEPVPGAWFVAVLVASSAVVAALCVTGAAVLARSRHQIFTAGWVTGAIVTIATVFLPLSLEARASVSLLAGPLAGLAVHLGGLAFGPRDAPVSKSTPEP